MDSEDSTPTGDNLYLILAVYFFVFMPWTIVQAIDFIGPEWKTVKRTLFQGYFQFVVTLIPIFVISVYIYFQAVGGDYKEMAAAIVALLFALQHILHTLWGIWQLLLFRRWAFTSIRTLRSHGIEYRLDPSEKKRIHMVSEWNIKVNETIVDNQIFGGSARCYLVWNEPKAGNANKVAQRPYEPVEVWINWAVAFAAQGLREWIENFDCALDPGLPNGKTSKGYEERQKYFAKELLTSAVLLLEDGPSSDRNRNFPSDRRYRKGQPLQWDHHVYSDRPRSSSETGSPSSFQKHGIISRREMLQHALINGTGLPFDAPHIAAGDKRNLWHWLYRYIFSLPEKYPEEVVQSLKSSGYSSYEFDLKQVVRSMPAKFGNAVDKFDVNMLECLTVLLNLGQRREPERASFLSPRIPITKSMYEILTDENLPVKNLAIQLGINHNSASTAKDRIVKISEQAGEVEFEGLVLPVSQNGLGGTFCGNRSVLAVSGIIDIWNALNAGDSIHLLLKTEDANSTRFTRTMTTADHLVLETHHCTMERQRLELEFGLGAPEDFHSSQSITFLGAAMENIRTSLAHKVRSLRDSNAGTNEKRYWNPNVTYEQTSPSFSRTSLAIRFTLSAALRSALRVSERTSFDSLLLEKRHLQIRLVWELQAWCHDQLQDGVGPESSVAMIACLLAFPSLRFTKKSFHSDSARRRKSESVSSVELGCKVLQQSEVEFGDDDSLVIEPVGGPQDFGIEVRIVPDGIKINLEARMSTSAEGRNREFNWEDWRDAFNERLRGKREWLQDHGTELEKEFSSTCSISSGVINEVRLKDVRVGEKLVTWTGWVPTRPSLVRFEVMTERLVKAYEEVQNPRKKWVNRSQVGEYIEYSRASRPDLDYTHLVVLKKLKEIYGVERHSNNGTLLKVDKELEDSSLDLEKAVQSMRKKYLNGESNSQETLQVFEVAAQNGNSKALEYAVELHIKEGLSSASLLRALRLVTGLSRIWYISGSFDDLRSTLEKSYKDLIRFSNYDADVVCSYVECLHNPFKPDPDPRTSEVQHFLRRSFRQTGALETLRYLLGTMLFMGNPIHYTSASAPSEYPIHRGIGVIAALYKRTEMTFQGNKHTGFSLGLERGVLLRSRRVADRLPSAAIHAIGKGKREFQSLSLILLDLLENDDMDHCHIVDFLVQVTKACDEDDSVGTEFRALILCMLEDAVDETTSTEGNRKGKASEALGRVLQLKWKALTPDLPRALRNFEKGALKGNGHCIREIEEIALRRGIEVRRLATESLLRLGEHFLRVARNSADLDVTRDGDVDQIFRSLRHILRSLSRVSLKITPAFSVTVDRVVFLFTEVIRTLPSQIDREAIRNIARGLGRIVVNHFLADSDRLSALNVVKFHMTKKCGSTTRVEMIRLMAILSIDGAEPMIESNAERAKRLLQKALELASSDRWVWICDESEGDALRKLANMVEWGSDGMASDPQFARMIRRRAFLSSEQPTAEASAQHL